MNNHESSWIISDHVVKRFTKMSTEVVERWWLHDKSEVGWCRGHFTPVWQCQRDSHRFILFISFISLLFNVPVAVHCIYIALYYNYIAYMGYILDMYMEYNIYIIYGKNMMINDNCSWEIGSSLGCMMTQEGHPSDLDPFLRWSTFGRTLSTFALQSVV